mgnify:CR=1 FL=1
MIPLAVGPPKLRRFDLIRGDAAERSALITPHGAQVSYADLSARVDALTPALSERRVLFLLGEKYIHAIDKLSASTNSKLVVLPADLQEAVRGLAGLAAESESPDHALRSVQALVELGRLKELAAVARDGSHEAVRLSLVDLLDDQKTLLVGQQSQRVATVVQTR